MPRGRVKTKGDEKLWRKARQTANARAKDDPDFKKDSDEYWAFINSQFGKFKSGELKIREQGTSAMSKAKRIFDDMVSGKVSTYADLMQFHGLAKDEADAVYRVAASALDKPDAVNQIANAIQYGQRRESTMKVADKLIEREMHLIELSQPELFDTDPYTEPDRETPRIVSYYTIYDYGEEDPIESGEHEDQIIEEFDDEWGIVDIAADYLAGEGANMPSSSPTWTPGTWYSTEPYMDPRTGTEEERTYNLIGFTADEEEAIYKELQNRGVI